MSDRFKHVPHSADVTVEDRGTKMQVFSDWEHTQLILRGPRKFGEGPDEFETHLQLTIFAEDNDLDDLEGSSGVALTVSGARDLGEALLEFADREPTTLMESGSDE